MCVTVTQLYVAAACVSAAVTSQNLNAEYSHFILVLSLMMAKVMPKHVTDVCSR